MTRFELSLGSSSSRPAASANDVLQQTGMVPLLSGPTLMYARYRAASGSTATSSKMEVREDSSPHNPLYLEPLTPFAADSQREQAVFFTRSSAPQVRVTFKGVVGAPVYIDNVDVIQVSSVVLNSPLPMGPVVSNETTTSKTYDCTVLQLPSCTIVDAAGAALTWPIAVPAMSSTQVHVVTSNTTMH